MKQKLIAGVCALTLLLGASTAASAEGGTRYTLDELGMSLEIPDGHMVFTRDTPKNDPNYTALGLTKESLDAVLLERNIYLNAVNLDGGYELVVTMTDNDIEDFTQFSDATLSFLASGFDTIYASQGLTLTKTDIYHHKQVKFIKGYVQHEEDGQTVYSLQYYTICNYQAINITIHSYVGEIDQEQEDILRSIADSADFKNAKPAPEADTETEPFEYTDAETGASFTVPANWIQKDLSQERETIKARFVPTQEAGLVILYGATDIWAQITPEERRWLTRADVDNSLIEDDAYAALLGDALGTEDVTTAFVTYGGKEYYMGEGTASTSVEGLSVSFPMITLVHIENGYYYQFQFSGERTSPYFKDFESLVASVQYPKVSGTTPAVASLSPSTTKAPNTTQGGGMPLTALSVGVALVIGMGVFIWFVQRKPAAPTAEDDEDIVVGLVCHYCGTRLPSGSHFCHKCGTRVIRKGDEWQ